VQAHFQLAGIDFGGVLRRGLARGIERDARRMQADEAVEIVERIGEIAKDHDTRMGELLVQLIGIDQVDRLLTGLEAFDQLEAETR
jgi:hypothetical protein